MDVLKKKHICYDIAILVIITITLGGYLIGTTVLISKDGIYYIECARKLAIDFDAVLQEREPFGFPALIFGVHYLASSILKTDSPLLWVVSAQLAVLACKTAAVVVLYFFASTFWGRRYAFWGILILLCLPYPAQFSADVLRDWPHLLFLFAAMLFLYRGLQQNHGGLFFLSGLICGLGHLIRPECAQVVLYGVVFFFYKTVGAIRKKSSIGKYGKHLLLIIGFLVVFLPCAMKSQRTFPYKLQDLYRQIVLPPVSGISHTADSPAETASFGPAGVLKAAGTLANETIQTLMYYFALPAGIGFYLLFIRRLQPTDDHHLLVGLFVGFYAAALCLLEMRWGYISRRHTLPLVALFCFYIPCGLEQMASWLGHNKATNPQKTKMQFAILLAAGILICLPKLVRPLGHDKQEYQRAAAWIAENTTKTDRFYTFDRRIPFYANRKYRLYQNAAGFKPGFKANYLIVESENGRTNVSVPNNVELQKTFLSHSRDREVLIFKRIP